MKIILTFMTLLVSISFVPIDLSAEDTQTEETQPENADDYDRIYKEDGYWYGVLEVEDTFLLPPWEGMPNESSTAIYFNFNRELDNLEKVKYEYETVEYCDGTEVLGICFSDKKVDTGTDTVFDEDDHGTFRNYITGYTAGIQEADYEDYDYVAYSNVERQLDNVKLIEFTYKLTEVETDNVNQAIQDQYNNEIDDIKADESLDMEEKQKALDDLNEEYADYTIEYGESIDSYCEGDCYVEGESGSLLGGMWHDLKTVFIGALITVTIGVILFITGLDVLVDLATIFLTLLVQFIQGVTYLIYTFIWNPLFNGIRFVLYKLFRVRV